MSDTEDGRELEEILDQRITIETNILDFFLISRWKGDWVRYSPVFIKGNINTQKKIEWSLLTYIFGAFILSYDTYTIGRNYGDRVEGVGLIDAPDSNGTSAALAPVVPFLMFYFWRGNIWIKIFVAIAGIFILNALILINSRGAFIGVFVGSLYFFSHMVRSKIKFRFQKTTVFIFIILGLAAVTTLVDKSFINRISSLTEISDEEKSGSHRYRMWLSAIDLTKDYPLGVGAYGFERLSQIYVDPNLFFDGQIEKAVHSIWFQALSETGILGFFFFLMLIFSTVKTSKIIKKSCLKENKTYEFYLAHSLQSSFITSLVASTFINQFRVNTVYWQILFIACLYSIIIKNSDN